MKLGNRIRGKRNQATGQQFENIVSFHANRIRASFDKIPSGCKWVAGGRAVAVPTPFDFIMSKNGTVVFFDAKTIDGGNFCYSSIDKQQLRSLLKHYNQSIKSGYLVWFRESDKVRFFDCKLLSQVKRGGSIKINEGEDFGSVFCLTLEKFFSETRTELPEATS